MANAVEPFVPYLPSCSPYSADDFWQNFDTRGKAFDLSNAGPYVYDHLVPSLIPGLVFGALALLGFVVFLVWLLVGCCVSCCRCCAGGKKKGQKQQGPGGNAAAQQFLAQPTGQPASYAYPPEPKPRRPLLTGRNAFWAFFLLLGLATIGVSGWGVAESIKVTNYTVSGFWDIVAEAQNRVEATIRGLTNLKTQAATLSGSASVLADNQLVVTKALIQLGLPSGAANTVAGALADAPAMLSQAPDSLGVAIEFLQVNLNQTIEDIENDFEPPTMAVQETWRFIAVAVLFGILILLVALAMLACWYMTWPKTAALLVALLWLSIAIIMLLGTGLMRGVYTLSGDGCLFAETFVINYVRRQTAGSKWGDSVVNMIKYYIGPANATTFDPSSLLPAGVDDTPIAPLLIYLPVEAKKPVADIYVLMQDITGASDQLDGIANDPRLQDQLNAAPAVKTALTQTGSAVALLGAAVKNLTDLANRENVAEVYRSTKEYICCSLKSSAYDMWLAWTIAGCMAFVLALLASGIIVHAAMKARKRMKDPQAAPMGGAVLWAQPREAPPATTSAAKETAEYQQGEYQPPAEFAVEPHSELAPVRDSTGAYAGAGYNGAFARA